jgi:hypothetical protein
MSAASRCDVDDKIVTIDNTIATMINYCNGGMGIYLSNLHNLQLSVNELVTVRLELCNSQVKAFCIIRHINTDKKIIGLQYADGKMLNPQQRVIACQNNS